MSTSTPRRRLRITVKSVKLLKNALAAVRAAADPASKQCGIEPEHREAMRVYLKTWAIWPLEAALENITGKEA